MQVDLIAITVAIVTSIISTAVSWGIMREKLHRMEDDIEKLSVHNERSHETFVSFQHFNAVLEPITKTLDALQADIKEVLHAIREKLN